MFAKWSICPCRWTICPAITFWSTTFTSSPPHAGEAASKAELAEIDDGGHVSVSIAKFSAPAIVWRWYVRCTTRAIVTTEPSGYTIESIDETGRRPPRRSGRLPRGTLSDEQILEAAGELAASRGIDAFTMPDVAKRLGVKVTSVYWYFRTRDDLVLALADRATREFYEGLDYDGDLEGDDRVLEHFFLYWRRLRANRLWREVFIHSVRRTIGRSAEVQARANRVWSLGVSRIVDAGLTPPEALRAYTVLSAYTRGYVLVQQFQDEEGVGADPEPGEEVLAFLRVHGLTTPPDPEQTFELGLRALWAGLSASVEARHPRESVPIAAHRTRRRASGV